MHGDHLSCASVVSSERTCAGVSPIGASSSEAEQPFTQPIVKGAYAMGPLAVQWSPAEIRASDFRGPLAAAIAAAVSTKPTP